MLNNMISIPHHYTAPKARETNTKASVKDRSYFMRWAGRGMRKNGYRGGHPKNIREKGEARRIILVKL